MSWRGGSKRRAMCATGLMLDCVRLAIRYDQKTGIFDRLKGAKSGPVNLKIDRGGYGWVSVERTWVSAHRLAWFMTHGRWPERTIDHINGDKLDNRIENLRDVPQSINNQNRHLSRRDNTSGATGVRLVESGKYEARVKVNGKYICMGRFQTIDGARSAYATAKAQLHPGYIPPPTEGETK